MLCSSTGEDDVPGKEGLLGIDWVTFLDKLGCSTLSSLPGLFFFGGAAVTVFIMFALIVVNEAFYQLALVVRTS